MKIFNHIYGKRVPWKFAACLLGTVLLCGFGRFVGSAPEVEEISFYAWIRYSREELLLMGEEASAYSVMASFRDMEWFIVFLPLLAAFSTVTDFAEQWFSGYYYPSISRKTRRRYAAEWMLRAAFRGFACIVAGILVYFLLVYCKFPRYEEFGLDTDASMIAMAYGKTEAQRFLTLVFKVFHTGLLAAVFAMGSVALTVFWKDSFFAVSGLVLVEYFSKKLYGAYEGSLIVRYYSQGQEVPTIGRIFRFFFPSNHLYYDQSFAFEYGVGYWLYLVFTGVGIAGIWIWFYRMVKRRDG